MRSIILYSSLSGNTKQVAEAIAKSLPADTICAPIQEAPDDLADYDVVFFGFWVDKGTANKGAAELIKTLTNKYIVLFATLGMYADSNHARESIAKAGSLLPEGHSVYDGFVCQGKISPKVIEMMYKMFPAGSPHGKSPERDALHKAAERHPDVNDLAAAEAFGRQVMERITK